MRFTFLPFAFGVDINFQVFICGWLIYFLLIAVSGIYFTWFSFWLISWFDLLWIRLTSLGFVLCRVYLWFCLLGWYWIKSCILGVTGWCESLGRDWMIICVGWNLYLNLLLFDCIWFYFISFNLIELVLIWFALILFDVFWFGLSWFDLILTWCEWKLCRRNIASVDSDVMNFLSLQSCWHWWCVSGFGGVS
jgi:hypothetical protein